MLVFPADIADDMWVSHAVCFNPEVGWPLNIHDDYPEAPLSPFYIDLGPILRSVVLFRRKVVDWMIYMVRNFGGGVNLVSDVPQKSTPYVASLSDTMIARQSKDRQSTAFRTFI